MYGPVVIVKESDENRFQEKIEKYMKGNYEISSTNCAVSSFTKDGKDQGAISVTQTSFMFVAIMVKA